MARLGRSWGLGVAGLAVAAGALVLGWRAAGGPLPPWLGASLAWLGAPASDELRAEQSAELVPAPQIGAARAAPPAPPSAALPAQPQTSPQEPVPPAEPAGAPPAVDLGLKLIGTVVGASPRESSALLEEADGTVVQRRIGQLVAGGAARLEEIASKRVTLQHGGQRVVLWAEDASEVTGHPSERQNLSAQEFFNLPLEQLEQSSEADEKRVNVDLGRAVAELGALARFSLAPDQSGLLVDGFEQGSPLARLGLRPGDRIVDVDGVELRSTDQGMRALAESLYAEGGLTVLTVRRRNGSRTQIALESGALLRRAPAPSSH
jgi:type II secretory pathway component PulC